LNTNYNEFKKFTLKSNNNNSTYDVLPSYNSSSSSYPHILDNGYETISSNINQQRFLPPISSSNVSHLSDGQLMTVNYFSSSIPIHLDSSLSTSNTISRTLTTFSHSPTANNSGNELSTMTIARLAEQEVIEV